MIVFAFVVGYMLPDMMNNMCGSILIEGKGRGRRINEPPDNVPRTTTPSENIDKDCQRMNWNIPL